MSAQDGKGLPVIGITLGDAAGIGSEIAAKMLVEEDCLALCTPVIIGDAKVFRQGLDIIKARLEYEIVKELPERLPSGRIYVYDLDNIRLNEYSFGQVSAAAGRASGDYIAKAVELALQGRIEAIVTNPLNKESFALGGYGQKYAGHTEMLADLTGTRGYSMMLACGNLRVLHVSTHVSLLEAILREIKRPRILDVIRLADQTCKDFGIVNPGIGVAGLNPHAGENGLFGEEEIREIIPAILDAKDLGLVVDGPVPADSLFSKALGGLYDAVVAMYHDQGHIPVKVAGFKYDSGANDWKMRGVNITLGLPVIRTSVDHGTAFGKAGAGRADHGSLFEALKYAVKMAKARREKNGTQR